MSGNEVPIKKKKKKSGNEVKVIDTSTMILYAFIFASISSQCRNMYNFFLGGKKLMKYNGIDWKGL